MSVASMLQTQLVCDIERIHTIKKKEKTKRQSCLLAMRKESMSILSLKGFINLV